MKMISWIPVIINPVFCFKTHVLAELNRIFSASGIRWSVEVTQGPGDATRIASHLAKEGAELVAVYGGDGTVSEVACGLAGTQSTLALLPGGTGNVLAFEFGIPRDLTQAAQLLVSEHTTHLVDMGKVDQRMFLLRAGAGLEAITIKHAPRELKEQFGLLAYGIAGLQAMMKTHPVSYNLEIDGKYIDARGVLCSVANASHLGIIPGLSLGPPIDISDGLLDIIVMDRIDLQNLITIFSKKLNSLDNLGRLQHWQVKEATIMAEPVQATQADGDALGITPMKVCSVPQALRVVVPY
jgi:YegS/Rv2252/BmrU family lipid kinase